MRELLIFAIHLLVSFAKLVRPGGSTGRRRGILLLKHQLLIANRSRRRAPNLTSSDRFVLALTTLFVNSNLRVLDIEEIKSVPYTPVSHPFVERLIGTIRREYLDRSFFWNAADLSRKLDEFGRYYNTHRIHRSLNGTTPAQRAGAPVSAPVALDSYAWQRHCRGLFQTPVAA